MKILASSNMSVNSLLAIEMFPKKKKTTGVPIVAQQLTNPTSIHQDKGSIPGHTQWVKDLALL